MIRGARRGALSLAVLAAAVAGARAAEPRLLATGSSGVVDRTGEGLVVLERFTGEIYLGSGKPGEVRYASLSLDRPQSPIPAELWLDNATFRLRPQGGSDPGPRFVQVAVPEGMSVRVDTTGARIRFSELQGDVEIRGADIELSGRGIAGDLDVAVERGTADVREIAGAVRLSGKSLDARVDGCGAAVSARLTGGASTISGVRGALDAELGGVEFHAATIGGPATLRALGGSVALSGLASGGEVRTTRAPLVLSRSRGDLDVVTDADLRFEEIDGPLHVESTGGAVRGSGCRSLLEVLSNGGVVEVTGLGGPTRIAGSDLEIRLKDVGDSLGVYASSSDVVVQDATAPVEIENDHGPITVTGATATLRVTSDKGPVRLTALRGALRLQSDGPDVEVEWAALPESGESVVANTGGGAIVRVPTAGGGARLEASTGFGRVESELPGVEISQDGNSAAGTVGRGGSATLRVTAEGDVRLLGPSPPPETPPRRPPKERARPPGRGD